MCKPVLGHAGRTAAALRGEGLTLARIAARMSAATGEAITARNVGGMLANGRVAEGAAVSLTPSAETCRALQRAAGVRGMRARTMAARLLELVAREGMIDAVLDDGIAPPGDDGQGADAEDGA